MRPVPGFPKVLDYAAEWAARLHAEKGVLYGGKPYFVHLKAVDDVLVRFGFSDPENPVHQCLRLAAYSHDLLEDVGLHPATLRVLQGPDVLGLVEAVTSSAGANRKERVAGTLPKTRAAGPFAVLLKVADRIANVEACTTGDRLWTMYRSEYPAFRLALYLPGEPAERMWAHLDKLLVAEGGTLVVEDAPVGSTSLPQPWVV